MHDSIGRPQAARVYAWLVTLSALTVILQGFLFSGVYSKGAANYLDVHLFVGRISVVVVVVALNGLAHRAQYPRRMKMLGLTVALSAMWVAQNFLGELIVDTRWVAMLHIPLGMLILALAVVLTGRAHRALAGRFD